MLLFLAGPEVVRGRHLPLLHLPPLRGEYVISNFTSSLFFLIYRAFFAANPIYMFTYFFPFVPLPFFYFFLFLFFCNLSTRRMLLLFAPYYLISLRWRYVFLFFLLHVFSLACVIMCPISLFPFLFVYICTHLHLSCIPFSFIFRSLG